MNKKAIKKTIEVWATKYNKRIQSGELMGFMEKLSAEPVSFNKDSGSIIIHKDRGNIELKLGNWLLFEINTDRKFWAIDEEIFYKTYEKTNGHHIYSKKPIEIEYYRLDNYSEESIRALFSFLNNQPPKNHWEIEREDEVIQKFVKRKQVVVHTLEGEELLREGEYLIRGIHGEVYPITAKSFSEVYEPL